MRCKPTWLLASVFALALAGCNSNVGGQLPGPCESDNPPAACGTVCVGDAECGGGFHCGEQGTCFAECTGNGGECATGDVCSANGRCVLDIPEPPLDCPDVSVQASPVTPTVQILIDQSISMDNGFNGTTRWLAVRNALVSPTGVVTQLQDRVEFGATLYTSADGFQQGQTCPLIAEAPPTRNNLTAITNLLVNNNPIDDTPTAESVTVVANAFPQTTNPRIIVLATDGLPDRCTDPDDHSVQTARDTELAVKAAHDMGIETYVLAVGPGVDNTHLQQMANAGVGQDIVTGNAPFFVANDQAELTGAFNTIIRGARTCTFALDQQVTGDPAAGTVTLNGSELAFESDWNLRDPGTLELLGTACDTFLEADAVNLAAQFPCGVVVIVD